MQKNQHYCGCGMFVQEVQPQKKHLGTMKYDTIKIVDLNPNVSEDQIYELICEKFSDFSDFTVDIVQEGKGRSAYLYFKSDDDAREALRNNRCIVLFGYACQTIAVDDTPGNRGSAMTEYPSSDYFAADDEYRSESFREMEVEREHASVSPDERRSSFDHGGRLSRGHRGGQLSRGGHWYRGSQARARGRNQFAAAQSRGRPYLLTKRRDNSDEDEHDLPATRSNDDSKPYQSAPRGRNQFAAARSRGRPYLLTKRRDNIDEDEHDLPSTRSNDDSKPYQSAPTSATSASDETPEREPNSTLYIGSMDPSVKPLDLKRLFNNFGYVLDVEIKHPSSTLCFAFVHFLNMDMACLAKREMEGKPIGRSVPKLGFGRVVASSSLWVGGLGPWTSEDMLRLEFGQFGEVVKVEWPEGRDYAFVMLASVQDATDAKHVMNGSMHGDPPHRIRVTYCTNMQMKSEFNYKPEFPKFPKTPRPESKPKKKYIRHSPETHFSEKRRSRDWESKESRPRRRRSPERSRSRSRPRKSHSHGRSRKRERSPSPYARSISQVLSDNDMSAISETSSESVRSSERNRQRKSHRKSPVPRSPVTKPLRTPSPPKSVMKDERTVVLRSEPQPVTGTSDAASGAFTSVLNQMHTAAVPSYVSPADPLMYYPPVASTLPPPIYPPPVHIPPPDFYMPPNPMMLPYPHHLPPLVSYPPIVGDSTQPVPAVCQSSVPPVQTSQYSPSKPTDKMHDTPVKEVKKPASSGGVAAKFPKVWSGALVLRNAAFVVDFHLLSGSVLLVNSLLGSNVEPGTEADCPVLKISQRLRLDQPDKLDELDRRLRKAGRAGCSVLLATSTPAQVDDDANVVQQYPLSSLVSYLLQKQVAAIVSLPPGSSDAVKATGVLHAFPPCKFAVDFLQREAPGLPTNCPTEEELLVVLCEI